MTLGMFLHTSVHARFSRTRARAGYGGAGGVPLGELARALSEGFTLTSSVCARRCQRYGLATLLGLQLSLYSFILFSIKADTQYFLCSFQMHSLGVRRLCN